MQSLQNKIAIVIGSSRGIGARFVKVLAENGESGGHRYGQVLAKSVNFYELHWELGSP